MKRFNLQRWQLLGLSLVFMILFQNCSNTEFQTPEQLGIVDADPSSSPPGPPGTTSPSLPLAKWKQLPVGNFISYKMNMLIIHPRPDSESGVYAAHRNAYPGIKWSIPIVVRGGAWPFFYEIESGPGDLHIGSWLMPHGDHLEAESDYGVLSWDQPVVGTYPIKINVYDQDYARGAQASRVASVAFTLVVSKERFIFIDAMNGSDNNSGTIDQPFKSIYKLHSGSNTNNVYAGKIVYLRAGTIDLNGMTATNGENYQFNGNQPGVFRGYPGEKVKLNFKGRFAIRAKGDTFFDNIEFIMPDGFSQAGGDNYFFFSLGSWQRMTLFNNVFSNYVLLSSQGENPSYLYIPGGPVKYVSFVRNIITGKAGNALTTYNVSDSVIELNKVQNANFSNNTNPSNGHAIWYLKDTTSNFSIRANESYAGVNYGSLEGVIGIGGQNQSGLGYQNIEYSYNKFKYSDSTGRNGAIRDFSMTVGGTMPTSIWLYRNSIDGRIYDDVGPFPTSEVIENNIVTGSIPTGTYVNSLNNSINLPPAIFDLNFNLVGSERDASLGRRGAEISY